MTPQDPADIDQGLKMIQLLDTYHKVRRTTEDLCAPLTPEDANLQGMDDTSPPKWHLAHTTWFFDRFLLHDAGTFGIDYKPFDERFLQLFNSYYETVSALFSRPQRSMLSRPCLAQVYKYRAHVDQEIAELGLKLSGTAASTFQHRLLLGINHEQQHQELILTDTKYNFFLNPLAPSYRPRSETSKQDPTTAAEAQRPTPRSWITINGGIKEIGHHHDSAANFAFDNETPRHRVYLQDFALASHPVTNGEFAEFIEAKAYQRPEFWLSDGWAMVKAQGWRAPLYWDKRHDGWYQFGFDGWQALQADEPACHLSFYEAHAYAAWLAERDPACRLPTEAEWEVAAASVPCRGNFLNSGVLRPRAPWSDEQGPLHQIFGDVWEWTQSSYLPYPGFKPLAGSLGEYNAKFMANQHVLRGGSCVTPDTHIRTTYRNFFPLGARWQFTGVRLARDV